MFIRGSVVMPGTGTVKLALLDECHNLYYADIDYNYRIALISKINHLHFHDTVNVFEFRKQHGSIDIYKAFYRFEYLVANGYIGDEEFFDLRFSY